MALLHQCGNGHWILNVSNCKRPLIRETEWGTTERDRQMDRKREGDASVKNEDKSLIDVENVETTCKRCCHLS